jgi:hypothetical protein
MDPEAKTMIELKGDYSSTSERPSGAKAAKRVVIDDKLRVAALTTNQTMASSAARRVELMEEQNQIAVCSLAPNDPFSIAFFDARRRIAALKAQKELTVLMQSSQSEPHPTVISLRRKCNQ